MIDTSELLYFIDKQIDAFSKETKESNLNECYKSNHINCFIVWASGQIRAEVMRLYEANKDNKCQKCGYRLYGGEGRDSDDTSIVQHYCGRCF